MTWAYFYFMDSEASVRIREEAPRHAEYWRRTGSTRRGGPFTDRTGGLIIFESLDEHTAREAVAGDPFQRGALLEHWWLKSWQPGEPATEEPS